MGVSRHVVSGPTGPLARIWSAECDSPTEFRSIASVHPGIGFARIGGRTALHLRGPATTDFRGGGNRLVRRRKRRPSCAA